MSGGQGGLPSVNWSRSPQPPPPQGGPGWPETEDRGGNLQPPPPPGAPGWLEAEGRGLIPPSPPHRLSVDPTRRLLPSLRLQSLSMVVDDV
ncbi:U1 small nuclear ribonucleoprotein C-like [Ischnura elegans]|uniref:U1 small nuclear ribonucleoprotein C-like n=1 Tax=Ischnura elegans TaxID=197161 RepID=UPI001ED89C5B|nr:U1 small nuclear ribonucleoprotein C-like [Ischnura elegans]